ncbi:MAG: dihydrofolate reductase family protein [Streptosporangiaceae bacterium]
MNDARVATGKVVVNRAMSLDGFIAGPGHATDWIFEYVAPGDFPEIMAETGAMLAGRRTYEVGERDAGKASGDAYGGAWSGPQFVLTHRPPADSGPAVTFLSGDIGAAVATARAAAGGRNVEILGTDVAGQCLQRGLVDEILVHILPVLLGGGTPFFTSAEAARIDLEPISSARSGLVTTLRFGVRK